MQAFLIFQTHPPSIHFRRAALANIAGELARSIVYGLHVSEGLGTNCYGTVKMEGVQNSNKLAKKSCRE